MSFEDRLSTSLVHTLDQLEVPAGDVGAARRAGRRQRRRRTWATGLAVGATLAVVSAGFALTRGGDDGDGRLDPAPSSPGWTALPDAPIPPRTKGIAAWTGSEAIFLGGETDNICPPNASCKGLQTYARDGAAYDPEAKTWRSLAQAPVPVTAYLQHVMVGDVLVLVADDGSWHAFDASEDQWRDLPAPADPQPYPDQLSALDGKVYALDRRDVVQVLDLDTATWSSLPASPHEPKIEAQTVLATPEGIVVIGVDSTAPNDGRTPSWLLAEAYEKGEWRRLERSDMIGGYVWHWTGTRLVAPDPGCADGGEVDNYGSCVPQGGFLDPGTGTWSHFTSIPEPGDGGLSVFAADGPLVASYGFVYDDTTGTWAKLPVPAGAADYDTAAVWADGDLIAFGGLHSGQGWGKEALSNEAWSWTP
jgi:hypothetical protein